MFGNNANSSNQEVQKPSQGLFLPRDKIRLRSPRSGDIHIKWEHPEETDVNWLLNQKVHKTENLGCASLVGEIAQIIHNKIFQSGESYFFGGVKFTPNGGNIYASLGYYSSYAAIIKSMKRAENANLYATAKQILANLSKGCVAPSNEGFDV